MTRQLSKALRQTADLIESGAYSYDWTQPHQCNCGLLVRTLANVTSNELQDINLKLTPKQNKALDITMEWSNVAERYCTASGLSEIFIFKKLFEAGMTFKDIHELEFMSNPEILKASKAVEKVDYKNKQNLIAYLWNWANIIDEKLDAQEKQANIEKQGSLLQKYGFTEEDETVQTDHVNRIKELVSSN
jgi:hypothetical protein